VWGRRGDAEDAAVQRDRRNRGKRIVRGRCTVRGRCDAGRRARQGGGHPVPHLLSSTHRCHQICHRATVSTASGRLAAAAVRPHHMAAHLPPSTADRRPRRYSPYCSWDQQTRNRTATNAIPPPQALLKGVREPSQTQRTSCVVSSSAHPQEASCLPNSLAVTPPQPRSPRRIGKQTKPRLDTTLPSIPAEPQVMMWQ
jgi:hypothetical protein